MQLNSIGQWPMPSLHKDTSTHRSPAQWCWARRARRTRPRSATHSGSRPPFHPLPRSLHRRRPPRRAHSRRRALGWTRCCSGRSPARRTSRKARAASVRKLRTTRTCSAHVLIDIKCTCTCTLRECEYKFTCILLAYRGTCIVCWPAGCRPVKGGRAARCRVRSGPSRPPPSACL